MLFNTVKRLKGSTLLGENERTVLDDWLNKVTSAPGTALKKLREVAGIQPRQALAPALSSSSSSRPQPQRQALPFLTNDPSF
jgi:hypothetical protein